MNKDELNRKLRNIFKDAQDKMEYGYFRWQDEREFEDINEYSSLFEPTFEKYGASLVKMTKRPFGCIFRLGEYHFQFGSNSQKCYIKFLYAMQGK